MAVADIGHNTAFQSGAHTTFTWTCSTATASGTLVCIAGYSNDTTGTTANCSFSDSKGNTYTTLSVATTGSDLIVGYSILTNALTTSDTFTVTTPSVTGGSWAGDAISITGYSTNDSAVTNKASTFANGVSVTGNTAAQSGEINVGWNNASSGTPTAPGAPWNTAPPTGVTNFLAGAWQVNSGTTGLTYNPTNGGTSASVNSIIASFKPTVAVFIPLAPFQSTRIIRAPGTILANFIALFRRYTGRRPLLAG
jgi:hypothetical protein